MIGDELKLDDDSNLLLGEAQYTSPLTQDALNLDIISQPMSAASPVTAPPAAAAAGPAPGSPEFYMQRASENASHDTTTEEAPPKLYSAKPEWFKGGPPPAKNQWAQDLVGMFGGAINAQKQAALNDPRRPLQLKMEDAKQAGLVGGMSSLLGGLINRPNAQYHEQLDAAAKESQMLRALPGGSRSRRATDDNLKLADLAIRNEQTKSLVQNRGFSQQQVLNLHDPNDPEAVAAQDFLAKNGFKVPDTITRDMLKNLMGSINQHQQQGATSEQHYADSKNQIGHDVFKANLQNEDEAATLARKDEQAKRSANIDPDMVWRNGHVGDVAQARDAMTIRKKGLSDLQEMYEIQNELDEIHSKSGGGWLGTIDAWAAQLGNPRAATLVARANLLRENIKSEFRHDKHMGVPQKWEDMLANSLVPAAGSFQGWAKGRGAWDAFLKEVDRSTYNQLRTAGAGLKSLGDKEISAGAYDTNQREAPALIKAGRAEVSGSGDGDDLGTTSSIPGLDPRVEQEAKRRAQERKPSAPTSSAAPPAAAPAAPAASSKYKITSKDGTSKYLDLSDERAKQFQSKGYTVDRIL